MVDNRNSDNKESLKELIEDGTLDSEDKIQSDSIYEYVDTVINKIIDKKFEKYFKQRTEVYRQLDKPITIEENDNINSDNLRNYKLISKVGDILREQGKSQTWLSEKTGIPRSTMYAIVNNTNNISAENASKIVKVLGLGFDEVFPLIEK